MSDSESAAGAPMAVSMDSKKEDITKILGDIKTSNERLGDIISYCEENFEANPPEVTTQTKQYASDAILNAAYQANQGADAIMSFFDAQMKELDKINANVNAIAVRYQGLQRSRKNMFVSEVARNDYKMDKVVKEEVGESKRQNNRAVIDFTVLDSVGISFGD